MAVRLFGGGQQESAPNHLLYADFLQNVYQLDSHAAAEMGFALGDISGSVDSQVLIIESVRSAEIVEGSKITRWGYGYRLLVEVSGAEGAGSLSLPAIAASAELKEMQARIQLQVLGWAGDDKEMWKVIPNPRPLGVDSYQQYIEAAQNVQRLFSRAQTSDIAPRKLSERDVSPESVLDSGLSGQELQDSVAIAATLRMIDDGWSVDQIAKGLRERLGSDGGRAERIAEAAIRALGGTDTDGYPDDSTRRAARKLVSSIRD